MAAGVAAYRIGTEGKIPFTDIDVGFNRNKLSGEVKSVAANYLANAGLVVFGLFGLRLVHNIRQGGALGSTQLKYRYSTLNRIFGYEEAGTWGSASKGLTYPLAYATTGSLAGVGYGILSNQIDFSKDSWRTDLAVYATAGALSGLALRRAPAIALTGTEMISTSALTYGIKKAAFEPAISRIEKWTSLKDNEFNLEQVSKPRLFESYANLRGETVGGDWKVALFEGVMAWSLFKVVRNSAQAYGRIGKVDGAWNGFKDGFIKSEAERRFFATREMGARNPVLTNASLIGSGAALVGIGGLDREGNINIPFVGTYSLPFSSKINVWLGEHIGLGGTSAGKVLQGMGATMITTGLVGITARAFYKNGSVAEGKVMWKDYSIAQKISGTSLAATKAYRLI
jgi:hypothetical protein